jgi:RHS repeat-associated protein
MQSKGDLQFNYDIENRLKTTVDNTDYPTNQLITLNLSYGWNFISFPVDFANSSISNVLSSIAGKYDQVSRYNPETGKFEHYAGNSNYDDFSNFEYGKGYQIYINNASGCQLTVTGFMPVNQKISLKEGLNLLSNPKIATTDTEKALSSLQKDIDYDAVYKYNTTTGFFENVLDTQLQPGIAYYVNILRDTEWAVNKHLGTTTYTYDGDGGRVKQLIALGSSLIEKIYVGSLYEEEKINGTTKTKNHIYLGSNKICTISHELSAASQVYYHSDHLGSTSVVTDQTGAVVQRTEYEPYGKIAFNDTASSELPATSYYFTGKELDSNELYYYGARYYDPELCRFIQADTIIPSPGNSQSFNRYSYCDNNPINYTDPTGHFKFKDFAMTIASIAVAMICPALSPAMWMVNTGVSAYTAASSGNMLGFVGGLAGGAVFGALGKGIARGLSGVMEKAAYNGFGGALIGAVEFGVSGFGSGLTAAAASGANLRQAIRAGGQGAVMGSISGAMIQGSYIAGWQDQLHGLSRREIYENGIKRSYALSVKAGDKTTAIVGSRPVEIGEIEVGRHRYIRGRAGHFEMGPDATTKLIEINGENSYDTTMDYLVNCKSQVSEATVVVSQTGFDRAVGYYKAAWEGTPYNVNSCNSNYAANTVIYGAGANVPGSLGFSPGFPAKINSN